MIPFVELLKGHQQVTEVYLLGLAQRKKGKLATMDRRMTEAEQAPSGTFKVLASGEEFGREFDLVRW